MQILSHRGWWATPAEKNSLAAFERSFGADYGTETDLRDEQGLREGDQLCDRVPGSLAARPEGRRRSQDADRNHEECVQVVGR